MWAIKDNNGEVLTNKEEIVSRWREHFVILMNEENPRECRECDRRNTMMEEEVSREEVKRALMKMKRGKAVGPDGIPAEVWMMLGEMGLDFLVRLFNYLLNRKEMPKEWRSILVPVYKIKGDAQSCNNYWGIKLMAHTMKLWEKVVEQRLRRMMKIGFMPGKLTTDAIFALRILAEKYREKQGELHCIFIDLEKAYDWVPREEV